LTAFWALLIGYLIGGIPTGVIIGRLVKGVDPRTVGSGSSGATNVSRVLGKKWAILVLLFDAAKGYLPVQFIIPLLSSPACPLAAASMMIGLTCGHVWTPYAGFRGGKGVAVAAGAMIALDAPSILIALGAWILLFAIFRIVSVASVVAGFVFAAAVILLPDRPIEYQFAAVFLALFLAYTHRSNLSRLRQGKEKKLV
jgi:glycerol-3-phosphate acyltransferase PlsY